MFRRLDEILPKTQKRNPTRNQNNTNRYPIACLEHNAAVLGPNVGQQNFHEIQASTMNK